MLDGTLFFVKSARYKKPDKDFVRLFMYYSCNMKLNRILNDSFNLIESAEKKVPVHESVTSDLHCYFFVSRHQPFESHKNRHRSIFHS